MKWSLAPWSVLALMLCVGVGVAVYQADFGTPSERAQTLVEFLGACATMLATAVALYVAVSTNDRTARDRRERDAASVKAILLVISNVYVGLRPYSLGAHQDGHQSYESLRNWYARRPFSEPRAALEKFDDSRAPSTRSLDLLLAARSALSNAEGAVEISVSQVFGRAEILASVRELAGICAGLGAEVQRLGGQWEAHDDGYLRLWIAAPKR